MNIKNAIFVERRKFLKIEKGITEKNVFNTQAQRTNVCTFLLDIIFTSGTHFIPLDDTTQCACNHN